MSLRFLPSIVVVMPRLDIVRGPQIYDAGEVLTFWVVREKP